ncbi:unnamed protein product [Tilletia controversa]|nr:unnamed protein product [Tilletia controversa]CAD6924222.1 unnamed protein product [Tilletia caries]
MPGASVQTPAPETQRVYKQTALLPSSSCATTTIITSNPYSNTNTPTTTMSAPINNAPAGVGAPQQDAFDKGIDAALKKAGHGQNAGTVEKISDGIRSAFKKATGKDVPIADKQ